MQDALLFGVARHSGCIRSGNPSQPIGDLGRPQLGFISLLARQIFLIYAK
jgi:hypothetical protein